MSLITLPDKPPSTAPYNVDVCHCEVMEQLPVMQPISLQYRNPAPLPNSTPAIINHVDFEIAISQSSKIFFTI
jgi:hypothetical protein